MNERIRELAEQAGIKEELVVMFKGDKRAYVLSKDDVEQFAELIIQECLELARSYPGQNEDYAAGIDSVRDSIKQHFGVER